MADGDVVNYTANYQRSVVGPECPFPTHHGPGRGHFLPMLPHYGGKVHRAI